MSKESNMFNDATVKVIKGTEKAVLGMVKFDYTANNLDTHKDVYVLINPVTDDYRYYTNSVTPTAAFKEITEHNGKFETLTTNFNGRNKTDMYNHLVKNYAPKVA